mgnify:CR=1 FL=1
MPRLALVSVAVSVAGLLAPAAHASELIGRNAADVTAGQRLGQALVTYRSGGRSESVLAWGAVDARHPAPGASQVAFRIIRSRPPSGPSATRAAPTASTRTEPVRPGRDGGTGRP